jgi:thioesterase domain-containing protein
LKQRLQRVLNERIPLTLALGLEVLDASPRGVRLRLPLDPNRNHQNTAFGGSLYSAAVLAGWGLLWCALDERGCPADLVIAASQVRYVAPVRGAFEARCSVPDGRLAEAFVKLERKGMARVHADSGVYCGPELCLVFEGTYGLIRSAG